MKKLDAKQLAEHNGQDGNKALVAASSKVYDVTDSPKWKDGKHMGRHNAGQDLSTDLKAAPHGEEVFQNFQQVGKFKGASKTEDEVQVPWPLCWLYRNVPFIKRHAHPFSVHYPIAFLMGAGLFVLLYHATGLKAFDVTAFHLAAIGTITLPVVFLTGLQSWWLFYGSSKTRGIITKLVLAPGLFIIGSCAWVLRATYPDILTGGGTTSYLYTVLVLLMVPIVGLIGYIGGQMTFPD